MCTHNSARSILGEAVASTQTQGRFVGYSAGSAPSGVVNPIAQSLAIEMGYPLEKLRSKNWDEFTQVNAPQMDFIITVCDNAAGEVCPIWLGKPITAHWGFPDPSQVEGSDQQKYKAFRDVMSGLSQRMQLLASLPLEKLDAMRIQASLKEIHQK